MINKDYISIASIVTCHNRCSKTITCLESLNKAIIKYNEGATKRIYLEVYLTDDGCTDDTVLEIESKVKPFLPVVIIKGDGNLFWAGGMRAAWTKALEREDEWDYYLLLNDDSILNENCFDELFNTETFCINKYCKQGIYSGITTAPDDPNRVTYGGNIWVNKLFGTARRLPMSEHPQECDTTNMNIMLVPNIVVKNIGILYKGYVHGAADYDYAVSAKKAGFPVLITAKSCGIAEYDHRSNIKLFSDLAAMSLHERKKHFAHPLHSMSDHITYVKRVTPLRYPFVIVGRIINIYAPKLFIILYKLRTR